MPAVGVEGQVVDAPLRARECPRFLACRDLVELDLEGFVLAVEAESHGQRPAVGAEGCAHALGQPRLTLGTEDLAGLRMTDLDLRVRPVQGQLGPVGAECQTPDHVLRTVKGRPPSAGLPVPQLNIRAALAFREMPARAGGDQSPIVAVSDRADASGG